MHRINKQLLLRYIYTIKYLKWKQIFYRIYYLFKKPAVSQVEAGSIHAWISDWASPVVFSSCLSNELIFSDLGESGNLQDLSIWNSSEHTKLWLYNLHYFDSLNSHDASINYQLYANYIDLWLFNNKPLHGNGWEPYPLSLRVVNWIKWFGRGNQPKPEWILSLMTQAESLMQSVEYHILGNHLFVNAKALIFLGTYIDSNRSELWLKRGLLILDREIKEQFLADGGHFELSTMYHASLLWDVCDLINLSQCTQNLELKQREGCWANIVAQGLQWLGYMVHPDGEISFFNDATYDIAPKLSHLFQYSQQLGVKYQSHCTHNFSVKHLSDSGYVVVSLPDDGKAIIDLAHVGPAYQPGHAHADTLSFELSLYGQRCVVNSGISEYGVGERRLLQRSTKAHNTVSIDNKNSSDVWSGFRVAKRARPFACNVETQDEHIIVSGAHDGYKQNFHHRHWSFAQNSLLLTDKIEGKFKHAEARFYFHPDLVIVQQNNNKFIANLQDKTLFAVSVENAGDIQLDESYWYPGFGIQLANKCLVINFVNDTIQTKWTW